MAKNPVSEEEISSLNSTDHILMVRAIKENQELLTEVKDVLVEIKEVLEEIKQQG